MIRSAAEFEANKLKEKIKFIIIKKDKQVIGFSLSGPFKPKGGLFEAKDCLEKFFITLPQMLYHEKVRIVVNPSLTSLDVYDPEFMGESLMSFPIKDPQEASKLEFIMKNHGFRFFKMDDRENKILGCKIVV